MSRKTDAAFMRQVELGIEQAVADGLMEVAGKDASGQTTYRMTDKGRKAVEAMPTRPDLNNFGAIRLQSLGEQRSVELETYKGQIATDMHSAELARLLGLRGYDVSIRQPQPTTLERRKAEVESRKRREAKRGGSNV